MSALTETFLVPKDEWAQVRRRVAPFASRDESQPDLCQVSVRVRNHRREWTATDQYRMARWRSPHPAEPISMDGTLHYSAFKAPGPAEVSLVEQDIGKGVWSVGGDDVVLRRANDAQPLQLHWRLAVDALGEAVKAARTAKRDTWGHRPPLVVTYNGLGNEIYGRLALTSPSGFIGHLRVEADGGMPAHVGVNARYLHSMVKAAGEGCTLHLPANPMRPIKVTNDRFVGLVMPVRL